MVFFYKIAVNLQTHEYIPHILFILIRMLRNESINKFVKLYRYLNL